VTLSKKEIEIRARRTRGLDHERLRLRRRHDAPREQVEGSGARPVVSKIGRRRKHSAVQRGFNLTCPSYPLHIVVHVEAVARAGAQSDVLRCEEGHGCPLRGVPCAGEGEVLAMATPRGYAGWRDLQDIGRRD